MITKEMITSKKAPSRVHGHVRVVTELKIVLSSTVSESLGDKALDYAREFGEKFIHDTAYGEIKECLADLKATKGSPKSVEAFVASVESLLGL